MMFEQIQVNMQTGDIQFPKLDGFKLDHEKLNRTIDLMLPHSGNPEMAVKHAIHQQLVAFKGMQTLRFRT